MQAAKRSLYQAGQPGLLFKELFMENKEITLTLSVNEVNNVLGALGKGPYEVVEPIIAKIREQAMPQVQENTEE